MDDSVSAAETSKLVANDTSNQNEILKLTNDDILTEDKGTFADLKNKLNGISDTEVSLDCDYDCDDGLQTITFGSNVVIDGNGHTIDGKGKSTTAGLFYETNVDNIVIKNLIFINIHRNGGYKDYEHSSVFSFYGAKNLLIDNCSFENCSNRYGDTRQYANGGSIVLGGVSNFTISNCKFNNISTGTSGGAIGLNFRTVGSYDNNGDGQITKCSFNNTQSGSHGGAIECYYPLVNITYCNFTSCSPGHMFDSGEGGAINLKGPNAKDCIIDHCNFINNSAYYGGAYSSVDPGSSGTKIINCNFIGNNATEGGAIKYTSTNTYMNYCNFTNNTASVDGGAICSQAQGSVVDNCSFVNNYAPNGLDFYIHGNNKITFKGLLFDALWLTNSNITDVVTGGYGISYERPAAWDDEALTFLNTKNNPTIYLVGPITNLPEKILTIPNLNIVGYNPVLNPVNTVVNSNNTHRAFTITSNNVAFYNLTFINGNASNSDGGALKFTGQGGKVINCTFNKNDALIGGAVSLNQSIEQNAPFTIDNCTFTYNNATVCGGAVYLCNKTNATIVMKSHFTHNRANDGNMAAIYYQPKVTYYVDLFTQNITNSYNNTNDSSVSGVIDAEGSIPTFTDVYVTPGGTGHGSSWNDLVDLKYGFFFVAPEGTIHFTKNGVYDYRNSPEDFNKILECIKFGITLEGNGSTITGVGLKSDKDYGYDITLKDLIFANNTITFIANDGPNNNIYNCTFINNTDTSVLNNGKNLKIENSTFANNTAKEVLISKSNNLLVNNCTFDNNTGNSILENLSQNTVIKNSRFINGSDSAILITNSSNVNINDCTFTDNTADTGAGIKIISNSTVSLNKDSFNNNTATDGGAIYNNATLNINNNTVFNKNNATLGGAIYNNATLNVDNSVFSMNNATLGGAIYNNATLNVDNSVFSMNNATLGGALYLNNSASIKSSSFEANTAVNGSAIYLAKDKNLELDNVVFKDNTYTVKENETYGTIYLNNPKNEVLDYNNINLMGHNDIYDGMYYLSTIYISSNGDPTLWGRSPDEATTLDNAVKHILDNGKIIVIEESDMFILNQTFNNLTNVTIVGNGKKFKTTEGDKYLFNHPKKIKNLSLNNYLSTKNSKK